jgi:2-oxoglutarate dehydrogenase E2 component (dihydrolipoamide succinyltransferase)
MATSTAVEVVMPQMGVSVSEGTITRWLKNVGDTVQADETLLEISTDKVDTEVPSPAAGVLTGILVPEGETVPVGTVIARIGGEPAAQAPAPPPPAAEPEAVAAEPEASAVTFEAPREEPRPPAADAAFPPVSEPAQAEPEQPASPAAAPTEEPVADGQVADGARFVSPVVARIAAEHGVDPAHVPGTGRAGRVTKRDILAFVESAVEAPAAAAVEPAAPEAPAPPPPAAAPPPAPPPPPPPPPSPPPPAAPPPPPPVAAPAAPAAPPAGPPPAPAPTAAPPAPEAPLPAVAAPAPELQPGEQVEPMNAMRRGIAEHMRRSLDTAAHVTSAIEVDMSKVVEIRERVKAEFERSYGVNPTYLAFIARATVDTLRDWPWVNAELRGESIVTKSFVNLGFAVALEGGKGLIVPVVKHAEDLNLLGMARAIADVAERARTKRLTPDDVQGGTFTITNPGSFGTFHGTPIISQPQSAILGTYAVVKRPWVITDDAGHDAIGIRPIMNLTLTYDHRLVDGAYGAQFLRDLRQRLETADEVAY